MLEHVLGRQQPHHSEVALKDLLAVTDEQKQDRIKEQTMPGRTRLGGRGMCGEVRDSGKGVFLSVLTVLFPLRAI